MALHLRCPDRTDLLAHGVGRLLSTVTYFSVFEAIVFTAVGWISRVSRGPKRVGLCFHSRGGHWALRQRTSLGSMCAALGPVEQGQ